MTGMESRSSCPRLCRTADSLQLAKAVVERKGEIVGDQRLDRDVAIDEVRPALVPSED